VVHAFFRARSALAARLRLSSLPSDVRSWDFPFRGENWPYFGEKGKREFREIYGNFRKHFLKNNKRVKNAPSKSSIAFGKVRTTSVISGALRTPREKVRTLPTEIRKAHPASKFYQSDLK